MNSSLYIAATGMKGLSQGMQVTTNNLANVSTIAYKAQDIQFSDIIYTGQANMGEWWGNQENSYVALGQVGHGLQVDSIRTIFQQGALQSSNTVTDLALNGKGYFQVQDDQNRLYYTRAGDFRPDNEGYWRNPEGLGLMGFQFDNNGNRTNNLSIVQVDKFDIIPPKGTSTLELTMNLNSNEKSISVDNPYFSLLGNYNATMNPPLSSTAYNYTQGLTLYDSEGNARDVRVYFDAAPSSTPGSNIEFLIASDVIPKYDEDGNLIPIDAGDGMLMSGVLQFDASGILQSMCAYTLQDGEGIDKHDLVNWVPATQNNGLPQLNLDGAVMTVDFGISGTWENVTATAADIGTDDSLLPTMGDSAVRKPTASTNFKSSPPTGTYTQDGYPEGMLSNVVVESDGTIVGRYSNSVDKDLWQVPVCRFTSEYNLYRQGNNLFGYTADCGQMEMGVAGTENYGTIKAYNIECSNVDMASEMVNMIVNQRGFQSNSKVVTTADAMLAQGVGGC